MRMGIIALENDLLNRMVSATAEHSHLPYRRTRPLSLRVSGDRSTPVLRLSAHPIQSRNPPHPTGQGIGAVNMHIKQITIQGFKR